MKRIFILTVLVAVVALGFYTGTNFLIRESKGPLPLGNTSSSQPETISDRKELPSGTEELKPAVPDTVSVPEPSAEDPRIPSEPVESYAQWLARQIAE